MRVHLIPFSYIQRVECTKSRRPVRLPVMARELFEPHSAHAPLVALQARSAEAQSDALQPTSAGLIAFFCRYLQQAATLRPDPDDRQVARWERVGWIALDEVCVEPGAHDSDLVAEGHNALAVAAPSGSSGSGRLIEAVHLIESFGCCVVVLDDHRVRVPAAVFVSPEAVLPWEQGGAITHGDVPGLAAW